jgi:hypothetical protein
VVDGLEPDTQSAIAESADTATAETATAEAATEAAAEDAASDTESIEAEDDLVIPAAFAPRPRQPLPAPDMSGLDRQAFQVLPTDDPATSLIVPNQVDIPSRSPASPRTEPDASLRNDTAIPPGERFSIPDTRTQPGAGSQPYTPWRPSLTSESAIPAQPYAPWQPSEPRQVVAPDRPPADRAAADRPPAPTAGAEPSPRPEIFDAETRDTFEQLSSIQTGSADQSPVQTQLSLADIEIPRSQMDPAAPAVQPSRIRSLPDFSVDPNSASPGPASPGPASPASPARESTASSPQAPSASPAPTTSGPDPGKGSDTRSSLGSFSDRSRGSRRRDDITGSASDWLGIAEDFDARKEGGAIGSWENFNDDDDSWRGGAFGGESFEDDVASMEALSNELLDKEVWLVALGASEAGHAGVRYFLNRHDRQIRGSLIINVLGVGAGDLCFTILEGALRTNRTDQRLQNLFLQAAQEMAVPLAPVAFTAFDTDNAHVLRYNSRAISLIGMGDGVPHSWRNNDDSSRDIRADKIITTSELILETIKNS